MVSAFAQINDEIEIFRPPRAEKQCRPVGRNPRPIRGNENVRGERVQVGFDDFLQTGGTVFFARLDHEFRIETEPPPRRQRGRHGAHIERVLSLVVGGAAAVQLVAALGDRPGIEPFVPLVGIAQNNVAMAIAQHGRQPGVLDPFGQQDRTAARDRVVENRTAVPHRLEGGPDLLHKITLQIRQPIGILAFRRNRHAAAQDFQILSIIETCEGARDRRFTAHDAARSASRYRWHSTHASSTIAAAGAFWLQTGMISTQRG